MGESLSQNIIQHIDDIPRFFDIREGSVRYEDYCDASVQHHVQTSYFAIFVTKYLNRNLGSRQTGTGGPVIWPPRS